MATCGKGYEHKISPTPSIAEGSYTASRMLNTPIARGPRRGKRLPSAALSMSRSELQMLLSRACRSSVHYNRSRKPSTRCGTHCDMSCPFDHNKSSSWQMTTEAWLRRREPPDQPGLLRRSSRKIRQATSPHQYRQHCVTSQSRVLGTLPESW